MVVGDRAPIDRRRFLRRLTGAALGLGGLGVVTGCRDATTLAQRAGRVPQVGYLALSYEYSGLYPTLSDDRWRLFEAFVSGMQDLGYVDGHNIAIRFRQVDPGKEGDLPEATLDLLRQGADVIVAADTTPAIAAKQTSTVPIVFVAVADPITSGLAASLARPGGNATGLISLSSELAAKRLDLLKEAFPRLSRVAVLWSSTHSAIVRSVALREMGLAAGPLGLDLQTLELSAEQNLQTALENTMAQGAEALVTMGDLINWTGILSFATRNGLPTMADRTEFVFAGGLMAYAPSHVDLYRRAAVYADKILRGARPSDLPIERPKRFQLIVNLQVAQGLGVAIPESVLSQADQVIPVLWR
jgi:putative tryptophan/tyrosine transport system substrate-binding protein